MKGASIPYEGVTTTSSRARDQIERILVRFGCSRIMLQEILPDYVLRISFEHRGRAVVIEASAAGWAAMYLRAHPCPLGRPAAAYKDRALAKGRVAAAAAMRDWLKGQVTAVECGMLPADVVFLPHFVSDGGWPRRRRCE